MIYYLWKILLYFKHKVAVWLPLANMIK